MYNKLKILVASFPPGKQTADNHKGITDKRKQSNKNIVKLGLGRGVVKLRLGFGYTPNCSKNSSATPQLLEKLLRVLSKLLEKLHRFPESSPQLPTP